MSYFPQFNTTYEFSQDYDRLIQLMQKGYTPVGVDKCHSFTGEVLRFFSMEDGNYSTYTLCYGWLHYPTEEEFRKHFERYNTKFFDMEIDFTIDSAANNND